MVTKFALLIYCILHSMAVMAIVTMIIYHCRTMNKHREKIQDHGKVLLIMNMLCMIMLLLHSLYDAVTNIIFFSQTIELNDNLCSKHHSIRAIFYHFDRFSLYLVWITQIYLSYNDSTFRYSISYVIAPLYVTSIIFVLLYTLWFDWDYILGYYPDTISCEIIFPYWWIFIVSIAFESFFSLTTLTLFVYPLKKMVNVNFKKNIKFTADRINNDKLIDIIIKKILLVSIIVLSTMIIVPFEIFGYQLIPLDDVINCFAILFMLSLYDESYRKYFGRIHKMFAWYFVKQHTSFSTINTVITDSKISVCTLSQPDVSTNEPTTEQTVTL
eukprot:125968_1